MPVKAEYKIEKGVPIAKVGGIGQNGSKYPFAEMDVGDSFAGPKLVRPAAFAYAKEHHVTFKTRTEGDGVRVWRIA